MANLVNCICLFVLICCFTRTCIAQAVIACPSIACNPRGSYSYAVKYPNSSQNAYVAWKTNFPIGPLPDTLGCVGNPNNIVCQSNGVKNVGYISLDVATGSLAWADGLLRFPVLPIMDIFGDVIGTDGHYLVMYDENGKLEPPIKIAAVLFPVYSLLISANSMILIVSHSGAVIGYEPDGSPEAAIWLTGTVERSNGTFMPITTPIIHENRCYVLTQFKPDKGSTVDPPSLAMRRLYAIDMYQRMVDRLHITWFFNFERMSSDSIPTRNGKRYQTGNGKRYQTGSDPFVVKMDMEGMDSGPNDKSTTRDEVIKPSLMFDVETNTIMVNLPPPEGSDSNAGPTLWGIKDNGDTPAQLFRVTAGLKQMAMFDTSTIKQVNALPEMTKHRPEGVIPFGPFPYRSSSTSDVGTNVWAVLTDMASIVGVSPLTGSIQPSIDVGKLMKVQKAQVTSSLMVTRSPGSTGNDVLIFGVEILTPLSDRTTDFHLFCKEHGISADLSTFVMGVSAMDSRVIWTVPLPAGMKAGGQIAGIPQEGDLKDILVVFAGNEESSTILAISSR